MVTAKQLAQQILQRRAANKRTAGLFFEAGQRGKPFLRQVQREVARIQEGRAGDITPREFALKQKIERGVQTRIEAKRVRLTPQQLKVQQLRQRRLIGDVVVVDGQKFSVRPSSQREFIKQQLRRGAKDIKVSGRKIDLKEIPRKETETEKFIERFKETRQSIRKKPTFIQRRIFIPLSNRQQRLIEEDKKRQLEKTGEFKLSLKSEIRALKDVKRKGEILGLTALNTTLNIAKDIKPAIKNLIEVSKEVKRNPKLVIDISKEIPNILKEEGTKAIELFKTSPTEAVGIVGGNVLFFAGTGKVFQIVGRIVGKGATLIKKAKGKSAGTKVKFIGTQDQVGNKIITKVVFRTNGKQVGGAIGTSIIKGNRILTQTVGKVGKIKIKPKKKGIKVKKFKQKGVFVGREVQVAKRRKKALKIITETNLGKVTRNLEGLVQVSLGKVATARGKKLLGNVIKFPTGELKRKKVKSLKVDDFVSLSAVLTRKDLSLIVGKTFKNKKDITEFIGLIKGTSKKGTKGISTNKRLLFNKALKDVAGTISASTPKAKKIIPKLSPRGKRAILNRVGGKVVKNKVVVGVTTTRVGLKAIQKARVKLTSKQISNQRQKLNTLLAQESRLMQRIRLATTPAQKTALKQRLILKTKAISRAQQKARGLGLIIRTTKKGRFIGLLKRKEKKIIKLKKKKKVEKGFNVFARPLKKRKKQKRPKLLKINKKPLRKSRARDLGSFAVDKSLARTFKTKRSKKKPTGRLPKGVPRGYFSRNRKKFRDFRIVKGKRKPLKNIFIEKKGRLLDTKPEKKGITLRKKISQFKPQIKRKATPQQLKNLAKGRKILEQRRKR
jgi:hypothetical protein